MAYAAQSDLVPLRMTQKDLNELTIDNVPGQPAIDPASSEGLAIVAQVTSAALEEASGIVDSYCRARYQTPLQTSDLVTSLTLDIGMYLLFSRRRTTKITETVQTRYDRALAFLKDISSSKASLDQPAGQTAQSSAAGPQISDRDSRLRFRECNIEGFV